MQLIIKNKLITVFTNFVRFCNYSFGSILSEQLVAILGCISRKYLLLYSHVSVLKQSCTIDPDKILYGSLKVCLGLLKTPWVILMFE
jgi:hypothetical protein